MSSGVVTGYIAGWNNRDQGVLKFPGQLFIYQSIQFFTNPTKSL